MIEFKYTFRILWVAILVIVAYCNVADAGPLSTTLDSSSRRSVQEAKMLKYGQQSGEAQSTSTPSVPQNNLNRDARKVVQITNLRPSSATGKGGRCDVKVGNVIQSSTMRGMRQQNVTVVEGNVINVCQ